MCSFCKQTNRQTVTEWKERDKTDWKRNGYTERKTDRKTERGHSVSVYEMERQREWVFENIERERQREREWVFEKNIFLRKLITFQ